MADVIRRLASTRGVDFVFDDHTEREMRNDKIDRLDEWAERRRQIAQRYTAVLDELSGTVPPRIIPGSNHVFHKYVLTAGDERTRLRSHLSEAGVGTMIHYAVPLHQEPVFSEYVNPDDVYPEATRLSKEALSLPIYPELEDSEIDYVCEQLTNFKW